MVLLPWEDFVFVVELVNRLVESDELEVVDQKEEEEVVVVVVLENVMEVEKQVELQVEQVQYFEPGTTQNAVWMYCL